MSGDILLKNLHMKSHVKITGSGNLTVCNTYQNLTIFKQFTLPFVFAAGMDGSLHAQLGPGSHEIQISQLKENSYVQVVNGTLVLKVPDPCPFGIRVNAQSIHATEKMLQTAAGCRGGDPEGSERFEYRTSTSDPIIEIDARKSRVQIVNEDWFSSLKLGFNSN